MRITFEDHGQDFLTWQLDNNGVVVVSPDAARSGTHTTHCASPSSAAEQAVEEYVASVGSLALYRTLKHAAARARAARAALGR